MTMKKRVVLQVLPSLKSGGVERGTLEIARAIAGKGWTSLVASEGGPMAKQLAYSGAEHITLPLASKNPFTIWRNSRRLAKIIRERQVDIIHARSRAPAWSAYAAAKKTKCHFVTTFHGFYGLQTEIKRKYNAVMTKGERVIAISNFIADHIRKNYPVAAERIRIIHRGVDLKLFHSTTHSPERMIRMAKEWHLPDEPVILFPGRLVRWKGQDVFIRALAELPHRHFFAVILGDDKAHGKYRAELEKLILDLGLAGHVCIVPHTPKITDAYQLARVVVATSLEPEAFGRVVLEAQAMGKPVIATNHGGPQETVVPNVTGWLVPPGDIPSLTAVIGHALALGDDELRWISEQAVVNAANFSLEHMCEKTLAVYEELLAG
jgi:glycosyltransferase involved in cell wall biosynthesis